MKEKNLAFARWKMEDQRRWEDLNVDCLVNVFRRVGMETTLGCSLCMQVMWKHLEELSLGSSLDLKKTLSEISIHCKKFWRLHVAKAYIGNAEALAIVKLVPDIKHLSLRRADIGRDNLVMLLQGCKELLVLDVSECRGFDEGDD
ncbi:hypothetical protein GBA52_004183 [Prunus armeniaca]|nr:hypothetical protein GBA52_004183 [Prunus armeniaca]